MQIVQSSVQFSIICARRCDLSTYNCLPLRVPAPGTPPGLKSPLWPPWATVVAAQLQRTGSRLTSARCMRTSNSPADVALECGRVQDLYPALLVQTSWRADCAGDSRVGGWCVHRQVRYPRAGLWPQCRARLPGVGDHTNLNRARGLPQLAGASPKPGLQSVPSPQRRETSPSMSQPPFLLILTNPSD